MRVLIAPDKFKGTLTARQAAKAIARGWGKSRPQDVLTLLPISDGGDGFGTVLGERLGAKPQRIKTVDAAHRPITATWWWQPETKTAVIESANIIGLAMLPAGKFHPFQLDTFGLGAVLRAARRKGARQIILGIGGSATNDGGFGVARALGWKFLDRHGEAIREWTQLPALTTIHRPKRALLKNLTVAVDVQNPLLGRRGATRVFGPQKGLCPDDFARAERSLRRLTSVAKRQRNADFTRTPGAGAAGGLGFGLATFAQASLSSGFALFATRAALLRQLRTSDLVITGEGALDVSTLMGKGMGQLAVLSRQAGIPVIGLAGVVKDAAKLKKRFTKTHALTDLTSPTNARHAASLWLARLAEKIAAASGTNSLENLVCKRPLRR